MVWPFPAGVLVLNTPNSCGGQSGAGPGGVWTEDARQRAPGSISHGCIQPTWGPLPPAAPVLPKFPFPLPPHHPCPAFSLRSHRKLTNPNKGRRAPTNSSKGQDWASPNPRKGQVEEPPIRTKDRPVSLSLLGRELGSSAEQEQHGGWRSRDLGSGPGSTLTGWLTTEGALLLLAPQFPHLSNGETSLS